MYVPISHRLTQDVRNEILNLRGKEDSAIQARYGNTKEVNFSGQEEWLLKNMWGDKLYELKVAGELPEALMCTERRYVGFRIVELPTSGAHCRAVIKGFPRHHLVLPSGQYNYSDYVVSVSYEIDPQFKNIYDFRLESKEVSERWSKVERQVMEFLNSCKSLNEGLVLWPELRRYVPLGYLKKVEEKHEKSTRVSKAAEVLKTMDLDTITASTVIARMSEDTKPTN